MSESGQSTALVPVASTPFQMPNFGGRQEYMKKQWEAAIKNTKLNIQTYVDKETSKTISRIKK